MFLDAVFKNHLQVSVKGNKKCDGLLYEDPRRVVYVGKGRLDYVL